jgi:hypothetical protein
MKTKPTLLQSFLLLAVLLTLPTVAQAQFNYMTNDDSTITIVGYTGSGGDVTIPDMINGLPVTSIGYAALARCPLTSVTIPNSVTNIGDFAFTFCASLTNVTIPNSVTSIGEWAFASCTNLSSITIPDRVTSIGQVAFISCTSLTNVIIGNSVTSIGEGAFESCSSLNSVTIPNSVTEIWSYAFFSCTNLAGVYFEGNAPGADSTVFAMFVGDNIVTAYYLPGTTGWENFAQLTGFPTALWLLPYPLILNFGPNFGV